MKNKYRLGQMITAIVNAAALIGTVVLTATGGHIARSQGYNYAAERWKSDSKDNYTQLSCFFSRDSGFEINNAEKVRNALYNDLKGVSILPEEGKELVPHAYSTVAGKAHVNCEIKGQSEAEVTAVGGDFFLFRDFKLLGGAFFSEDSLMQDGAVIDRQLAWNLYGSENIAGKKIYINGTELYISGVIDTPGTKYEKKCSDDVPKAYITYYTADLIFGSGGGYGQESYSSKFSSVTCYECVVPDPVKNFAYNSVKGELLPMYEGSVRIVNNTERFLPEKSVNALKRLDDYIVRKDEIAFPYWENASRLVELRLSFIYGGRRLLLAIMLVMFICLLALAYKRLRQNKQRLRRAAEDYLSEKLRKIKKGTGKKDGGAPEGESSEKESEQTKESKNNKNQKEELK